MPQFKPICVTKSLFYLHGHLRDSELGLGVVAAYAGFSPGHLSRQLRKHVGQGFREIVSTARMTAAKNLLQTSRMSIKAIALELGYRHPSGFTRDFARAVGLSPSQWRASVFD